MDEEVIATIILLNKSKALFIVEEPRSMRKAREKSVHLQADYCARLLDMRSEMGNFTMPDFTPSGKPAQPPGIGAFPLQHTMLNFAFSKLEFIIQ